MPTRLRTTLLLGTTALIACLASSIAFAKGLEEKDLKACELGGIDRRAEELLRDKDVAAVFSQDDFESFALKVLAPHLLAKKVIFYKGLITCRTLREEDPASWAACLGGWLSPAEIGFLKMYQKCLKAPSRKAAKSGT